MRIQVCLMWQMKYGSNENGGMKSFSCQIKAISIMYPYEKNVFIVPNPKNNRNYYENPSLSYLTIKLCF